MIAAVYTCRNEADIVEMSFRHTLNQGVDRIYVMDHGSTDGTRDILNDISDATDQITIVTDDGPYHMQARWMSELAAMAAGDGYEWIIASDVDEFVYATNGGTVANALKQCEHDKLYMNVWQHVDKDHRFLDHHLLPKVAFRWKPGAWIAVGNHEMSLLPGGEYGVLDMRELKFRGFEHYIAKALKFVSTSDPTMWPGNTIPYLGIANMSEADRRREWDAMMSRPIIYDPIPS
jgi:glycosyltransferase involved in cell wall biosynthesis